MHDIQLQPVYQTIKEASMKTTGQPNRSLPEGNQPSVDSVRVKIIGQQVRDSGGPGPVPLQDRTIGQPVVAGFPVENGHSFRQFDQRDLPRQSGPHESAIPPVGLSFRKNDSDVSGPWVGQVNKV